MSNKLYRANRYNGWKGDWRIVCDDLTGIPGYAYVYGRKQAASMPFNVVIFHKSRCSVYGFKGPYDACKFIFDRIPCCYGFHVHDFNGYYHYHFIKNASQTEFYDVVFASPIILDDIIKDHYHCHGFDFRGF